MSEDDPDHESFEERVRSIAREVSRSVERITRLDIDEIAEAVGVDPARAKRWVDDAGRWLGAQAERAGDDAVFRSARPAGDVVDPDPLRGPGPHPLDLPTAEQGRALAALDSGRWTVQPGSNAFVAPAGQLEPNDVLGLVGELRARDWIAVDGELTLVGRDALRRWLEAANPRSAGSPSSDL
ncbi:MAG: helix-hairpin-helix domain-containing protein [Solirubrobacteraceae bacterium]